MEVGAPPVRPRGAAHAEREAAVARLWTAVESHSRLCKLDPVEVGWKCCFLSAKEI